MKNNLLLMINNLMVTAMACFQRKGSQLQDNQQTCNRPLGANSAKRQEEQQRVRWLNE